MATVIVHDDVKAHRILIQEFKEATDLCWQKKEMGRVYFVAHSPSCELSLINLFNKVAIRIMKEQFGLLLKTNPHKSILSQSNEDDMTSSSSSDYGTDKEDNDKNNDKNNDESDDESDNESNDESDNESDDESDDESNKNEKRARS